MIAYFIGGPYDLTKKHVRGDTLTYEFAEINPMRIVEDPEYNTQYAEFDKFVYKQLYRLNRDVAIYVFEETI